MRLSWDWSLERMVSADCEAIVVRFSRLEADEEVVEVVVAVAIICDDKNG